MSPDNPTTASAASSRNATFDSAYKSFYESLPEKDRLLFAPCATAQDLQEGLKKLANLTKKKRQETFAQSLVKIIGAIEPYLNIVDVMVQSNPTYAALIWGSLRFVLQLASNFSTFFEKLLTLLANLSAFLPHCDEVAVFCEKCPEFTAQLRYCVEKTYENFFGLFAAVAKLFTSANGKLKRTAVVIGTLLWKPFDLRYQDLIVQFREYRSVIHAEIQLVVARLISSHCAEERPLTIEIQQATQRIENRCATAGDATIESLKENAQRQLKKWICAPPYDEIYHRHRHLLNDPAENWLLCQPQFEQFIESPWERRPPASKRKVGGNALWVQGMPGIGKTVFAASVTRELRRRSSADRTAVCYHFFDSRNPQSTPLAAAYRAILTQIIDFHSGSETTIDKFSFLCTAQYEGAPIASSVQVTELMKVVFSSFDGVLVFDGIDECNDASSLTDLITWLSENTTIKIIMFSRPNVTSLARRILKTGRMAIARNCNDMHIHEYLTSEIEVMVEDEYFPPGVCSMDLLPHLVQGADGMILWAKLMIGYLKSPMLTTSKRFKDVTLVMPEGLEQVYHRIIDLIQRSGPTHHNLAKRAFEWVLYNTRPMSAPLLHRALACLDDELHHEQSTKFKDFEDMISIATGGLLECFRLEADRNEQDTMMRFIHMSAVEYFHQNSGSSPDSLLPKRTASEMDLTRYCLSYAMRLAPKDVRARETSAKSSLVTDPFASYAVKGWILHFEQIFLNKSGFSPVYSPNWLRLASVLSKFLACPVAISAWLEFFYGLVRHRVSDLSGFRQMQSEAQFSDFAQQFAMDPHLSEQTTKLGTTLKNFADDITTMEQEWSETLLHRPGAIWDELVAFFRSPFLANPSRTSVTFMAQAETETVKAVKPLAMISKSGVVPGFGNATAVLSVWPTISFLESWKVNPGNFLDTECDDWCVHYDVWLHGKETTKFADVKIPLESDEVQLQIRQSFHFRWEEPQVCFPLVIGDSLLSFGVLRTIFVCQPGKHKGTISWASIVLPLDLVCGAELFWCDRTWEHGWHYSYTLKFSTDDKRIFFSGSTTSNETGEIGSPHIAVLLLETGSRAKLLGSGIFTNLEILQRALFHPFRHFLLLSLPNGIQIWHYEKDTTSIAYVWRRERGTWSNGEMNISRCGKFLLLGGYKDPVPLPEKDLNMICRALLPLEDEKQLSPVAGSIIIPSAKGSLRMSTSGPLRSDGEMVLSGPSGTQTLDLHADGDNGTITLRRIGDEETPEARVLLTSIPQWSGYMRTSQTIFGLDGASPSFTIVVDKSAEERYNLDRGQELRIIHAIKRSLAAVTYETLEDMNMKEARVQRGSRKKARQAEY